MSSLSRTRSSALALLLALGSAGAAAAQGPTLKTINVDGDLSDWDEVLLNPLQVTRDGDGSTIPCSFSPDLDCDVQSAGRDMRLFAWTYDADHVYVYLRRQGSSSNEQVFWFYLDVTGPLGAPDELMGAGDRVLRVRYNGSNGVTANTLYPYLPSDPAGDPMTDAGGVADGHVIAGEPVTPALWLEGVPNGGSAAGTSFEERVPWQLLGVPAGTGLNFHVSSSNSPNPSNLVQQVDDNLGGPTGGIGTFAYDLLEVVPDQAGTVAPGQAIDYVHQVRNIGSRTGTYALRTSSSLGAALSLAEDSDGDGLGDVPIAVDANGDGDFGDAGDSIEPGWDLDADGFPEIGPIPPGGERILVLTVQSTAGMDGLTDLSTITAWLPSLPGGVEDAATDTTQVGSIVLGSRDTERNSVRRQNVQYDVAACNNGVEDVLELSATSSQGWQVTLYSDPECDGVQNDFLAQDTQGDGTWDFVLPVGDSDGNMVPDTGPLPTGECRCFVIDIAVRNQAVIGDIDVTTVQAVGVGQGTSAELDLTTTVTQRLLLFPDYLFADGTFKVTGPGRSVYFGHVVRNNWREPDRIDLTAFPPVNDQGWPVRFWSDPNLDGNIFDGDLITLTDPIPPYGGETGVVVEVRVPDGVGQLTSTTMATGASDLDNRQTDTVVDELEVSSLATYSEPTFSLPSTFFPPCATIYVEGTGLERPSGQFEDLYDLLYFDGAGVNVRFHDPFAPDVDGSADDSYLIQGPDAPGRWRIELRFEGDTAATVAVTVEGNGVFDVLATDQPAYPLTGSALGVASTLRNANVQATLSMTTVEYVVLDPSGTQYLVSGAPSTFAPYSGSELTRSAPVPSLLPSFTADDPFTVPDVVYPTDGVYAVRATWRSSCGTVLATSSTTFVVGGEEICDDGVDNDIDTLADCDDPECAEHPSCVESECNDGLDNDDDSLVDCDDPDCVDSPFCNPEEDCEDGIDNDGDTVTDCDDPDCATTDACPEDECTDGVDNDGDTLTDCDDLDCATDPTCQPEPDCQDDVDNDGDTLTDCEDPDCFGSPFCAETDCDDGIDNDGDGPIDCDDTDCASQCPERDCSNGADDDGDTLIDCADPDCAGQCSETVCDDGIDNDGDGPVDCEDPDCVADPTDDCDGDGIDNGEDCDPADPGAFAVPTEVTGMRVRIAAIGTPASTVSWDDHAVVAGTGTVHDVLSGPLAALRGDGNFDAATCLPAGMDVAGASTDDPAAPAAGGTWYLVRAQNACGTGPYGSGSLGPRVIDGTLCD